MFLSKSKKLLFQVDLVVISLENIPLLDGSFYIKLKLNRAGTALTPLVSLKTNVVDHTVIWKWPVSFKVTFTLSEDQTVMPCVVRLVVKKDGGPEKRSERIGVVFLDLAHFIGSKASSSKHLLQDSRINSLLKLTTTMTQLKGILDFKVPTAPQELQIDISRVTRGLITLSPSPSFASIDSDYINLQNMNLSSSSVGPGGGGSGGSSSEGFGTPPSKAYESKPLPSMQMLPSSTSIKSNLQIPLPLPHLSSLPSHSPTIVVDELIRKVLKTTISTPASFNSSFNSSSSSSSSTSTSSSSSSSSSSSWSSSFNASNVSSLPSPTPPPAPTSSFKPSTSLSQIKESNIPKKGSMDDVLIDPSITLMGANHSTATTTTTPPLPPIPSSSSSSHSSSSNLILESDPSSSF